MSWSDIIYSDNPKRRDKLVRLCAKLYTLLETNFRKANQLIDCINEHIPGSRFSKVSFDMDATVESNCNVLIKRLEEINRHIEQSLRELAEKLDTQTFNDLTSPDKSFQRKLKIAHKVSDVVIKLGATALSVVVMAMIKEGMILVTLVARLGTIATCVLAAIGVGVLVQAVDVLISVIIGEIEKRKLMEALSDIQAVLDKFEPASDKFNRSVDRLVIRVEDCS